VPGPKTNERPGTRAVLRHFRMSPTKARQVLDLIRGEDVDRAADILRGTPREAARVVAKVLASAVANAQHNEGLDPEELYVSACYADEGTTLKRWRPRARGRATRIRKRTCHITVIVSRLPEERLERRRARAASAGAQRSRRVAASRRGAETATGADPSLDPAETTGSAAARSDDTTTGADGGSTGDAATGDAEERTGEADDAATDATDEATADDTAEAAGDDTAEADAEDAAADEAAGEES
jgi:large subunit ribosomal protein L22